MKTSLWSPKQTPVKAINSSKQIPSFFSLIPNFFISLMLYTGNKYLFLGRDWISVLKTLRFFSTWWIYFSSTPLESEEVKLSSGRYFPSSIFSKFVNKVLTLKLTLNFMSSCCCWTHKVTPKSIRMVKNHGEIFSKVKNHFPWLKHFSLECLKKIFFSLLINVRYTIPNCFQRHGV